MDQIAAWLGARVPGGWFEAPPEITEDRDEILVVGRLSDVDLGPNASDDERSDARAGRIVRWREETRDKRIRIAREAERRFGKKVSWGAECGAKRALFTTISTPVMTRLRMPERSVLDTLVEAGVARSRSHALAWCVRLVGKNQKEWIDDLRSALVGVEEVRSQGPS
jgi:hypothetical protein